jgi:hypothetical protein
MSGDPKGTFTIATEHVVLAQTDLTTYSIRRSDWKRFVRDLGRCDFSGVNHYANVGFLVIGIGVSAAFGLVSLYASEPDGPTWAKLLCGIGLVGSVIVATALLLMSGRIKSENRRAVTTVKEDMEELEKTYPQPPTPPQTIPGGGQQ